MAPRGPKGKAAPAGRETRSVAKTSSRGGIQKRRGGPARVDNDGDLDMGAPSSRRTAQPAPRDTTNTRPRTGLRPSNGRGPSKAAQTVLKHLNGGPSKLASRVSERQGRSRANGPPLAFLRVHGLKESKASTNPDGGLSDLLSFLERKASSLATGNDKRQVSIKKSHRVGDYVFIGASKEDFDEIIKLNTFTFAGSKLEIVESIDGLGHSGKATESKDTQELRAKLQQILSQRYIGANKLLKLDSLHIDQELVSLGMFSNRDRALKTFKGLMAICDNLFKTPKEKQEAIESISLATNNIDHAEQVEAVASTFPQLKNLDLTGNQIVNVQALIPWKGKFRALESLYLNGNPIETTDPNYQATLLDWFPQLQTISGTQLRTEQQIAEQAAASQPKPIPQHGPDFRDVAGIGENFLLEFFTAYDNDRQGLAMRVYDEDSQFSLAVDTMSVRHPDAPPPLPWGSYIKVSRNLRKVNYQNPRMQRLFRGANAMSELWKGLPLTKHPSIKEEMSKYIMDCHPLTGLVDPTGQNPSGVDGLIISVHGEFDEFHQETNTTGKRSFSRTFILGPGKPGRNSIRVVSDMLSLRAYSPLPNVFATPAAAPVPPSQTSTDPNQHQAMLAELSKQTGMTLQYSEMCLSQVDWDFGKALAIFNEKKSQLPAEAFAVGAQQ